MKVKVAIASALLLTSMLAPSQTTVFTDPVGYVSVGDLTNPGVVPAVDANTDLRFGIPLLNTTKYIGSIATSGVGVTTITAASAAFITDEWAGHYVIITSGANEGQILLVTSNTATVLTVVPMPGDALTGLVDGDTFNLSQAWTIDSLIGDQPVGTRLLLFSGSGNGINIAPDTIYAFGNPFNIFPSARWYNASTYVAAGSAFLFPGEAMILRAGSTAINSFVISGTVPYQANRVIILGGTGSQDTPMAYTSPVNEPIISANLPAADGDRILVFSSTSAGINKSASVIYAYGNPFNIFPSPRWYNASTYAALTTESFEGGKSYVYRRAAAGSDVVWSDNPVYVP